MKTTWRVKEIWGGLEFRRGGEGLELSPSPYFNKISPRKRVLRLSHGDIGLREACRELCRLYGDQWQDLAGLP